jgi:hypothetical protein
MQLLRAVDLECRTGVSGRLRSARANDRMVLVLPMCAFRCFVNFFPPRFMDVKTPYYYLVERPDQGLQALSMRETGVCASTIWHDRFISRMPPQHVAHDRDIPVNAVYEALAYCQGQCEVI